DIATDSVALLGTLPVQDGRDLAIVRILKLSSVASQEFSTLINRLEGLNLVESNDIYTWFHGWLARSNAKPDVKIDVIFPATDVHVRKYSAQSVHMVHESIDLYRKIVKPYVDSFPPKRTQWVRNILDGTSESEKLIYSDPGYVLLPDMKWDAETSPLSTLYVVAIAKSVALRSLRDLRGEHIPLLKDIRRTARQYVQGKGLAGSAVRMFIHYQPSYYHFHVHVVNANHFGSLGTIVGQAHLLDDVISLLELDGEIYKKVTLNYGLGDQHALCQPLLEAQLNDDSE
ncbi:scavenger mRNA decapping enzyme, partial [Sistotremastrum suecicum HHB10207 ss-3]